jgi:spore coat protein CotF
MNDKEIMEGILLTAKGVCDLYMHGSIESATPKVQDAFNCALNSALTMQSGIYSAMADHGWYPAEVAPPQKLRQVKEKYANIC